MALPASSFDELLGQDPAFARAVARELARQLQASGGLDAPSTRPRVLSVVPLGATVDAQRLAAALTRELARFGAVVVLRGDESVDEPAALLARAEAAHDTVVLLAGAGGTGWDAFCRRQGDRVLLVAGPQTPVSGDARGCDLVLLAPLPPGTTARWLSTTEPARPPPRVRGRVRARRRPDRAPRRRAARSASCCRAAVRAASRTSG